MENIKNKISYLQGLIDGSDFDSSSKEGKIFAAMNSVLSEMVLEMEFLSDQNEYARDMIEELLDEELIDDDDFYEEEFYDEEYDDDIVDDLDLIDVECPTCHDTVYFEKDAFENNEDLICPNCSGKID